MRALLLTLVGILAFQAVAAAETVIVYLEHDAGSDRFVVRVSTPEALLTTGGPPAVAGPSLSPNGDRIAYTGELGDRSEGLYAVFVVNRSNGNVTQITPGSFGEFDPSWAPNGNEIVVSQDTTGNFNKWTCCRLVVFGAGGGQRRVITNMIGAIHPDWSPNGSTIAFQTGDGIYTVPAGGGSPAPVVTGGREPAYSPSGTEMAYLVRIGGQDQLRVRTVGSSSDRLLYASSNRLEAPVWIAGEIVFIEYSGDGAEGRAHTVIQRILEGGGSPSSVLASSNPLMGLDAEFGPIPDQCPSRRSCDSVAFQDSGGRFHVWDKVASPHGTTSFFYGNPGDVPFSGDWNCDGVDTLGLYRRSDGFVYLRNSNTQGVADITFFFGNPGDLPVAGDFNNNGCDTVSLYRPSEARFYIINRLGTNGGGLGAADFSFVFGNPGDKPFIGDFNGDGIDSVGLHRESTGLVYFRNALTTGIADSQFIYGNPGDMLVAGDWNGDRIDTVAVYRRSTGFLYIKNSNTQGVADATLPAGSYTGFVPIRLND